MKIIKKFDTLINHFNSIGHTNIIPYIEDMKKLYIEETSGTLRQVMDNRIIEVVNKYEGDVEKMAEVLDISKRCLLEHRKRLKLKVRKMNVNTNVEDRSTDGTSGTL